MESYFISNFTPSKIQYIVDNGGIAEEVILFIPENLTVGIEYMSPLMKAAMSEHIMEYPNGCGTIHKTNLVEGKQYDTKTASFRPYHDIVVLDSINDLWTSSSSSYDVPQNGTFDSESVLFNGFPIFHWSDNNGLNGWLEENELELVPTWVKEKFISFQERDEKYREYCEENWDEDGFNNFTAQGF